LPWFWMGSACRLDLLACAAFAMNKLARQQPAESMSIQAEEAGE
jgi:hypothetical protein